jgi:hypothetical protein
MIQDLDKTIEKLLYERGKLNRNEIDISFEQPTGEWSARINRPTLNCYVFDLRENIKLRSMDMAVSAQQNGGARISLRPMRYDLMYLVTAWARRIEDEHQLLWRALGALVQVPKLDPADCEGALRDQMFDIPLTLANVTDRMPSMTDLWSVLDNQMRLGFTLVVTLALESGRGFDAPLVLERQITFGQSDEPQQRTITAEDVVLRRTAEAGSTKPDEGKPGKSSTRKK